MKILLAKTAGFCMGVRRAVEIALDTANRATGPVYTYGPLIHNPQVLDILKEKGVSVLEEIPASGRGTVIIRAHGVTPRSKDKLSAAGFTVVDATCPRVVKVQSLIRRFVDKGHAAVIVGDPDHPEVVGLLGYAGDAGRVVSSAEEVAGLDVPPPVLVVAQTTQDEETFRQVVEAVKERFGEDGVEVFNTICDSTARRQAEAAQLAAEADAVVVVGGRASGNTRRLAKIAQRAGVPVFHVETEKELPIEALCGLKKVGLTAGASTPHWIIRRVHQTLADPKGLSRPGPADRFFRALFLTNLYLALGASAMAAAAALLLLGIPAPALLAPAAGGYILSMHILNNFIGRNAFRYNDPSRARYYEKNKTGLLTLAALGIAVCLGAGAAAGPGVLAAYLAMTAAGLLYNVPLSPSSRGIMGKYPRIRSLPGSKTLVVAGGWAIVCALIPAAHHGAGAAPTAFAVFWVFALVFARTAFFDVLDVQVDRMVGAETVATWLGPQRTLTLCRGLLAGAMALLVVLAATGVLPAGAWLLFATGAAPAAILYLYGKKRLNPGWRLELVMDTNFLLAGLLAGAGFLLAG